MKINLLSIAIALTISTAAAQELKVSLRSENGPLPYAYLYLYRNGRAAAVSDTSGVARLAAGQWRTGDTLTVSYAGMTPESRVIDAETARKGHCEMVLQEIYASLTTDQVVVRGDVERFFRKAVRACEGCIDGIWGEAQLTGDATMTYGSAQNGLRDSISGRITTHRNEVSPRNYMDHNYRLTIDSSTQELRAEMISEINHMLKWATTPIFHFQDRKLFGASRHLSYLGTKEGHRIFRVTFPEVVDADSMYIQIVVYIDETTKLPQIVEAEYLRKDMNYSVRIRAEYTPYQLNVGWGAGRICLTPVSIDYRMSHGAIVAKGSFRNGRFLSPICTLKRHRGEPIYTPYPPKSE